MGSGPWRPRAGERVRVCDTVGDPPGTCALPHYAEERGSTGIAYVGRPRDGAPDHPYLVSFDRPVPVVEIMGCFIALPARHYAADELEPLDG